MNLIRIHMPIYSIRLQDFSSSSVIIFNNLLCTFYLILKFCKQFLSFSDFIAQLCGLQCWTLQLLLFPNTQTDADLTIKVNFTVKMFYFTHKADGIFSHKVTLCELRRRWTLELLCLSSFRLLSIRGSSYSWKNIYWTETSTLFSNKQKLCNNLINLRPSYIFWYVTCSEFLHISRVNISAFSRLNSYQLLSLILKYKKRYMGERDGRAPQRTERKKEGRTGRKIIARTSTGGQNKGRIDTGKVWCIERR